jgi:1,4-dihydroxy-2-naphthoate octaprenyltransferase
VLLVALAAVAFVIPIAVAAFGLAAATVLLVVFAIPIAVAPVRSALAIDAAPELVGALKRMAMAELTYALLFSLGLVLR